MTKHVLQGPFLTRSSASRRGHIPPGLITHRPDLLRLGGRWLEEVYFAFQFDREGVRPEVGSVVQAMKRDHADQQIAEWLVAPNAELGFATPLDYLDCGGSVERVLDAAGDERTAPLSDSPEPSVPSDRGPQDHGSRGASHRRRVGRRSVAPRPLFGN